MFFGGQMSTTSILPPSYTLSRQDAFQFRTFQDRAREARVTALQDRAHETKELAKELEWQPLFETFKDLKKYKTTIADQDLFEKAKGKLDPSTVYRLENKYDYKKNSLTLSAKAITSTSPAGFNTASSSQESGPPASTQIKRLSRSLSGL
jgi:hypothetical protein